MVCLPGVRPLMTISMPLPFVEFPDVMPSAAIVAPKSSAPLNKTGARTPSGTARKVTVTAPKVCAPDLPSCHAQFSQCGVRISFRVSGGFKSTFSSAA